MRSLAPEEKKQDPQAGQGGDGHPQMVKYPNSMGVSYHEYPNIWMLLGGFKHEWMIFHIWDISYYMKFFPFFELHDFSEG